MNKSNCFQLNLKLEIDQCDNFSQVKSGTEELQQNLTLNHEAHVGFPLTC